MTNGIKRRLATLEAAWRPRCPACEDRRLYVGVSREEAEAMERQPPPATCPACGRRLARLYVAVDLDRV